MEVTDNDQKQPKDGTIFRQVSGFFGQVSINPLKKSSATYTGLGVVVLFFFLFLGALVFPKWNNTSIFLGFSFKKSILSFTRTPTKRVSPLNCTAWNQTRTCPIDNPIRQNPINLSRSSNIKCPEYFRWIHEDLRHWKKTGITREMMEGAHKHANFKLVIVNGKAYLEKYHNAFQTRDLFTLWGIVQLLKWYPGGLPDLELLFNCDDMPILKLNDYRNSNPGPPPLFRYCSDDRSLDIVFPDWSFWGWVEVNIKPWRHTLKDIKAGNKRIKWENRVPLAYWKGNPYVASTRGDLMKCNDKHKWNTVLYTQDWVKATHQGFKQSHLEDQCTHRYKIYIEGRAWSVSEKYILACNSPTLYVKSPYWDFFTRGLVPLQHYWPIKDNDKCKSLKFAVEWGNNHTAKAKAIGEASSNYMREELKMGYVYDYMFHLLNEYAKLLKFKPSIPPQAVELCAEAMACPEEGVRKKFMIDSFEESPSDTIPCNLPPHDPQFLKDFIDRKANLTRQVEKLENEYWSNN